MGQRTNQPTIYDVAERAGVSKSLVSLVMWKSPKVSDRSRAKVMAAAEELGYRPNALARNLVGRRTDTIGVVTSDHHNSFFADVLNGIEQEALRQGLTPFLANGARDVTRENTTLERFLQHRVDALVLLDPTTDPDDLDGLVGDTPTILIARRVPDDSPFASIRSDDVEGARLAVEHLLDLGHERILHVSAPSDRRGGTRREQGYREAMAAAGLGGSIVTVEGNYTEEGGYRAVERERASGWAHTAVFAANDLSAIGAVAALRDAGLRVPEEVSVVGYDNGRFAAMRHMDLTSVDMSGYTIGVRAVETSSALQERAEPAARMVVAPRLAIRSSTSSPPPTSS